MSGDAIHDSCCLWSMQQRAMSYKTQCCSSMVGVNQSRCPSMWSWLAYTCSNDWRTPVVVVKLCMSTLCGTAYITNVWWDLLSSFLTQFQHRMFTPHFATRTTWQQIMCLLANRLYRLHCQPAVSAALSNIKRLYRPQSMILVVCDPCSNAPNYGMPDKTQCCRSMVGVNPCRCPSMW